MYVIPLLGVDKAITELQCEYNSCEIDILCTRSGDTVEVMCFQSATSLKPFAYKFTIMAKSAIFNSIWSKTMEAAYHKKPNMAIRDVGPKIWKPAFTKCKQLLEELHSGSMTLSDVDKHFCQYKGEQQRLEGELKSLFLGVNKCCEIDSNSNWIHQAVTRIAEYWRLCAYCGAANSFLRLRDSLELTKGDFKPVEKISKEVNIFVYVYTMKWEHNVLLLCTMSLFVWCHSVMQMFSSMKDKTLAGIDEQLLSDGKFLSEFTGHNLECITTFCECQDIVQWIRKTTEGTEVYKVCS